MSIYLPHYEWAIILGLSMCLWCFGWVRPRYGAVAAALLGYLGLSALWVWVWVENRYLPLNVYDQMALRYFSADSLARLLIVIVPLMMLAEDRFSFFERGRALAFLFVVFNSIWILGSYIATGCVLENTCGGVGNPSIMASLAVCLLPIVIRSWSKQLVTLALVVAAILASKSSIALGLLGIYAAYAMIYSKKYWLAALLSAVPLAAGYFMLGKLRLFSSSDRFLLWKYMMPKWAAPNNLLNGTGWGTYHVFSIHLQAVKNVAPGSYWNTLHNDWLQVVFECGIIGSILFVGTYLSALWRAAYARDAAVAMSIVLYGIYMGVNPALHHAIPSLFGAWLFIYALKRNPHTYEGAQYA